MDRGGVDCEFACVEFVEEGVDGELFAVGFGVGFEGLAVLFDLGEPFVAGDLVGSVEVAGVLEEALIAGDGGLVCMAAWAARPKRRGEAVAGGLRQSGVAPGRRELFRMH